MSAHKHYQMTNTHILVQEFEYLEPSSLEEAISLLSEYDDRAQVLAGGTDLIVQMKMERITPEYVVNISRVSELNGIVPQKDSLQVGALTTIRTIRNAPQIQAEYTALAEACAAFGSTQIQMMGTIGGNVCNGSPASDTVPALMAFDAQFMIAGLDDEKPGFSASTATKTRFLSAEEFLIRLGKTALQRGELLTSIQLQRSRPGTGSAFIKVSRVEADLAKVSVAAVLVRESDRVVECRLAFGAVGPTVLRTRKAEAVLTGQPFSAEMALQAGQVASEEITPVDDVRSTAWYRREVVKAITHDVLLLAWERAEETRGQGDQGTRRPGDTHHVARSTHHVARDTSHEIELTINGVRHRLSVRPNELLLNVLRERLELRGSKYGCGIGECGACTVLLNGKPTFSCLVLAIAADGSEVVTVEGLASPDGELDPLQNAFIEHAAFQCGYCTPGMLMTSKGLLQEIPSPTEEEIRDYLKGNRCRCTGFTSIVRAVSSCAAENDERL